MQVLPMYNMLFPPRDSQESPHKREQGQGTCSSPASPRLPFPSSLPLSKSETGLADTLGWGQMCLLGYRECRASGLFLPLLLSRFQRHLLSSVFGGVSRALLSLLAKPCCVCPPSGVRHPEAAGKDAHSRPCSRKLPLQQPKVFLSLLFPVCSLSLWMRHFPRSQLIPKVRSRLCCGICRRGWARGWGWEGTFPAPITPQRGP